MTTLKVLDGDLLHTVLASADLALEDTAGVGGGAHGTGVTVDRAAAVGHTSAAGVPALDNARVAVALAGTGDVNEVAGLEGVSLDDVADVQLGSVVKVKLTQVLLGGNASLVQVAHFGLGQLRFANVLIAQLNSLITFLIGGLLLRRRRDPPR